MNTGYRLDTYKDVNPYSSTYGNTKTEKIEDIIMCPYISGEVIFKVNIGTDNYLLNKAISKTSSLIISVDWGDGSIIEEIGNGITDISHTYSIAGDYTISVTMLSQPSTVDIDLSNRTTDILKYSTLSTSLNNVFTDSYALITQLNPVFTLPNITIVSQPFTYCGNLVRVEDGTFDGIFSNTDSLFGLFYICENLEYVPTDILKDFKGGNINSIFYRCNKLSKNINDLLSYIDLSKITTATQAFYGDETLTGNALPIINQLQHLSSSAHRQMFYNCTGLSDYNSIPTGWK